MLVEPAREQWLSVAKLPLAAGAERGILREARILDRLRLEKPAVAPRCLYFDGERGVAVQEPIVGRPTGRRLSTKHVEWLRTLRRDGEHTSVSRLADRLAGALLAQTAARDADIRALERILSQVTDPTPIPTSWGHGDFAPWNLRSRPSGELVALDWEFADPEGALFADLFYFRSIQNYLFGDRRTLAEIRRAIAPWFTMSETLARDLDRITTVATAIRHLGADGSRSFLEFLLREVS